MVRSESVLVCILLLTTVTDGLGLIGKLHTIVPAAQQVVAQHFKNKEYLIR